MEIYDSTVSANPKINRGIAAGFAKMIESSVKLQKFTLVHFRMSAAAWEEIGYALGKAKGVKTFICTACNLYQNNNLQKLLEGKEVKDG